jgi:hypothetical protein
MFGAQIDPLRPDFQHLRGSKPARPLNKILGDAVGMSIARLADVIKENFQEKDFSQPLGCEGEKK